MRELPYEIRPSRFPDGGHTSLDLNKKPFLKKLRSGKYQLYTQVDAGRSVVYAKGAHFVNRTGVYAIVPVKGYKPEKLIRSMGRKPERFASFRDVG